MDLPLALRRQLRTLLLSSPVHGGKQVEARREMAFVVGGESRDVESASGGSPPRVVANEKQSRGMVVKKKTSCPASAVPYRLVVTVVHHLQGEMRHYTRGYGVRRIQFSLRPRNRGEVHSVLSHESVTFSFARRRDCEENAFDPVSNVGFAAWFVRFYDRACITLCNTYGCRGN